MSISPQLGNRYAVHSAAMVPQANMQRSFFNRSHTVKDTWDFDYLNPAMIDEVLPGDTCNITVNSFIRLAPQVVPLLDNMYVDWYGFFIPERILWTNFVKFMGEQVNPGDSTDYLLPILDMAAGTFQAEVGTIYDKMGLPTDVNFLGGAARDVRAGPFRAYNLIYNKWFRDENLQNSVTVPLGDGPDSTATYQLLKGGKKHDYFTSSLPWPQKGEDVLLSVTGTAPVVLESTFPVPNQLVKRADTGALVGAGAISANGSGVLINPTTGVVIDPNGTLNVESAVGELGVTVNNLREAIMLQSLLELDARAGTRYPEVVKGHFNVVVPDFRVQYPEFLFYHRQRIVQHVVAQTSETTTDDNPLGRLAAYSTSQNFSKQCGFSKAIVEHGWILILGKACADVTYQQGLDRMWSRSTRYDMFWPKLQQMGEQAVLTKEIYYPGTGTSTWGYQERYAEYRQKNSQIRGQFRSTYAQTLDVWHMAEEFGSEPALNAAFIQSNTPIERSLVAPAGYPHLLVDLWFDYKHARPMMTYGVPATLGRF